MLYAFEVNVCAFPENVVVDIRLFVKPAIVCWIIGNDEIARTYEGQKMLILTRIGETERIPIICGKCTIV